MALKYKIYYVVLRFIVIALTEVKHLFDGLSEREKELKQFMILELANLAGLKTGSLPRHFFFFVPFAMALSILLRMYNLKLGDDIIE